MASGLAVGLPDGQMGNSEVGHLNIGAGRVIKQELVRINDAVSDGSFYGSEAFIGAVDNCKRNNSALPSNGPVFGRRGSQPLKSPVCTA